MTDPNAPRDVPRRDPHSRAADAVHAGRPVEAQYVRQGRGGRRILWVLLAGVALVSLAFALLWLGSSPRLAEATTEQPAAEAKAAAAFQGPAASPTAAAPTVNAPTDPAPDPRPGR